MLSNLARTLAALSGSRQIKSFSSFIPRKLMQCAFLGSLDFAVLRLANLTRQKQHQILAKTRKNLWIHPLERLERYWISQITQYN